MRLFPLFLAVLLLQEGCAPPARQGPDAPSGLLVELLRFPEDAVITDPHPEFSWIVNDINRGATQRAYQLLVASDRALLSEGKANVWDSGEISTDKSVGVTYGGPLLEEQSLYWWTVRTYDRDMRASPFAEPQLFRTGGFEEADRSWPFESRWVNLPDGRQVLENRQRPEFASVSPERLVVHDENSIFADFGKAAFGTLSVTLENPGGVDSVIVFLGERTTTDNRVHKEPGRSNIGFVRHALVASPGRHTYTLELPRHHSRYPNSQVLSENLHEVTPFRYVEIQNLPAPIDSDDLVQLALFYPFDESASFFHSSDDALNRVWELCKYTLKATPFLALYADGNRERMPYEADAHIQQLGHYAVDREFAVARYTHQFLVYNPAWPTEWHLQSVLMAWWDYLYTGDLESAFAQYDDLMAKTYLALEREDGLISTRTGLATPEFLQSLHYYGDLFSDIVDWPPGTPAGGDHQAHAGPRPEGERDGYVFMPYNTVVNAFHYRALVAMAEIASALGRMEEAGMLSNQANLVADSFAEAFFDPTRGIYTDGIGTDHASIHANMFPLAFGLVPDEHVPSVVAFVKSRGMACSVYGAQFLLEGLFDAGAADVALDLMTSNGKRGWLNMLRVGSTMTTEAWDEVFKPNLTWNHAWGSAPANIIPRKLFGIEPIAPGFSRARIRPQLEHLDDAEIRLPTIRGSIQVTWKSDSEASSLSLVVPANMEVELWLRGDPVTLEESHYQLFDHPDIEILSAEDGVTIAGVKSGSYTFTGIQ